MTSREIIRALEAAGFELFKRGARHDLYKKGDVVQVVSRAKVSCNPRAASSLRALLRRVERGAVMPAGRYV